ncbi:hypothetical protein J1N35_028612 [Gossypium stocksii]|uniref:Uncharacterized protein n=1 Tax=Gossypium stocksii TaxID=47602 RepID=A0A9D3ZSR6_9ROSI|nr:hypothetical protein J1N35_028612 [Gossypium stocksii]
MEVVDNCLQQWEEAQTVFERSIGYDFGYRSCSWLDLIGGGYVECNVDAASFPVEVYWTFAAVARDHDGRLIRGLSGYVAVVWDPRLAKIYALREKRSDMSEFASSRLPVSSILLHC